MQKIRDKGGKIYLLPTKPEELRLDDFMKMCRWRQEDGDLFDLVAAFADMPKELAIELADFWEGFDKDAILEYLFSLVKPKRIKQFKFEGWSGSKAIKVKEFEHFTTQQRLMIHEALKKHEWDWQALPDILAIGIAPQIYPEDWVEELEVLKEEVLGMDASIAVPTAYFFLKGLTPLSRSGTRLSFRKILFMLKREVTRLLKRTAFGRWL